MDGPVVTSDRQLCLEFHRYLIPACDAASDGRLECGADSAGIRGWQGHSVPEAQDLTQEFFDRLLAKKISGSPITNEAISAHSF